MSSLWFDAEIDLWPLVMGILLAVSCGLLGTVFLLRRVALLGDAVSHSVLPGVGIGLLAAHAFLGPVEDAFGASVSMLFVLAGALLAGLAATALIEAFHRYSRIKPDTALGAVFPAFFALGVVLISREAGFRRDLGSLLFGNVLGVSTNDVWVTLAIAVAVAVVLFALLKELTLVAFDATMARAAGYPVFALDLVLLMLVSATIVVSLQAVGNILILALIVTPPAAARLLTDRLRRMMALSVVIAVVSGVLGLFVSYHADTAAGGTIVLTATAFFLVAVVFAPTHGLLSGWLLARRGRHHVHHYHTEHEEVAEEGSLPR